MHTRTLAALSTSWLLGLGDVRPLTGCESDPTNPEQTQPTANSVREIVDTDLAFDVGVMTASARITLGRSEAPGASLEIGDLDIERVTMDGTDLPFADNGVELILGLPASSMPVAVEVDYRWQTHDWDATQEFSGASSVGYTNTWATGCAWVVGKTSSYPKERSAISLPVH